MKQLVRFSLSLILFATSAATALAAERGGEGGLHAQELRCEYHENPLGIDCQQPRLSWLLKSQEREQYQTAYQVIVSENEAQLESHTECFWDSGKVESNQTIQVTFTGPALEPRRRYY
jgi:alpha-L-rhamnosidase